MYQPAIHKIIAHHKKPVSATEITHDLQAQNLTPNQATVFRILDSLVKTGTVRKIISRYELATDDHHHFTCDHCGKIEDINSCQVTSVITQLSRKKHLLIKNHILEFTGLCAQCQ